MRVLIIGAVAAGTSAATEIRRHDETADIVLYERDAYISYAGCGMPYYISDELARFEQMVPRDAKFFKDKFNINILVQHDVLSIHPARNAITVRDSKSGKISEDFYDALIIATGASSMTPKMKGVDGGRVFSLRTVENVIAIKAYIADKKPKTAAIIGTGLVGLELCESLTKLGIHTTLIARSSVAKSIDKDMTEHIETYLREKGVDILTDTPTTEITPTGVVLGDGSTVEAELVILATGIRPNVELARAAGIEIGVTGAIKVDSKMKTSVSNIYSCGDCSEQFHVLTGKPIYRPLGSTANKTGVIAGNNVTGGGEEFQGVLGTGIFRIFDMTVAQTGLSEQDAKDSGIDVAVSIDAKPDRPPYMNGKPMIIKTVADKSNGRLLGAQIVGFQGVDKRIDVLAAAITLGGTAQDLIHMDLAYAPPFSTPRDPLYYTGIKLKSEINQD